MSTPVQITGSQGFVSLTAKFVATLHLQQASSSGAASSGHKPNIKLAHPTPQGVKKSIEDGSTPIHPSRLPVTLREHSLPHQQHCQVVQMGLKERRRVDLRSPTDVACEAAKDKEHQQGIAHNEVCSHHECGRRGYNAGN